MITTHSLASFDVIRGIEVDKDVLPSVFMLPMGCTGTFIGPRVFITAAHCLLVDSYRVENIKAKIYKHPKYRLILFHKKDYANLHDVAIGILEKPLSSNKTEMPITICENKRNQYIGSSALLVGLGCNTWPGGQGGGVKRFGYSTVDLFDNVFMQLDAGSNGGLSCPGDSGAPYLLTNEDKLCYVATNFHSDRQRYNRSTYTSSNIIRSWLLSIAKKVDITICGINSKCKDINLPDQMKL